MVCAKDNHPSQLGSARNTVIGIATNMVIKVLMSYTMVSGFGIWDLVLLVLGLGVGFLALGR